jgi:autotransporter passenger strand-loop-strand repeat protein
LQSGDPNPNVSGTILRAGAVVEFGSGYVGSSVSAGVTLKVLSGGVQEVLSGTASGTTVESGGQQNIFSGGTAVNTKVHDGGVQNVQSAGIAISATVSGTLATQFVSSSGTAVSTTISSGGFQDLRSGALGSSTKIGSQGVQDLDGGTAIDTTIGAGGLQQFSNNFGGTAINTTIASSANQFLQNRAVATNTTISGGH